MKTEGMELPNGISIKNLGEKEHYIYLGNTHTHIYIQTDNIKYINIKKEIESEYIMRDRKILKSKLNRGNIIQVLTSGQYPSSDTL